MALKDFMSRTPGSEPARSEPPAAAATPRPAPSSPVHTSYLGPSFTFSGEMRCGESLRIDGKVKGEVHCEHQIAVGEKGSVHASIEGDSVMIAGEVKGDIKARRKITLESTARVTGDLTTPGIVIQEGARLEGRIMIGGAPSESAQPASTQAASAPAAGARPRAPEKPASGAASSVIASGA
jgi:cytoskeletal protein CcmA (bactofilin family)